MKKSSSYLHSKLRYSKNFQDLNRIPNHPNIKRFFNVQPRDDAGETNVEAVAAWINCRELCMQKTHSFSFRCSYHAFILNIPILHLKIFFQQNISTWYKKESKKGFCEMIVGQRGYICNDENWTTTSEINFLSWCHGFIKITFAHLSVLTE